MPGCRAASKSARKPIWLAYVGSMDHMVCLGRADRDVLAPVREPCHPVVLATAVRSERASRRSAWRTIPRDESGKIIHTRWRHKLGNWMCSPRTPRNLHASFTLRRLAQRTSGVSCSSSRRRTREIFRDVSSQSRERFGLTRLSAGSGVDGCPGRSVALENR
jgi:hypothetical protein